MTDLMTYLEKHKENRGVMATLRRALIPNQAQRAWPLLANYGGIGTGYRERVVQVVAGLYALHPKPASKGNLGHTCRAMLGEDERRKLREGETSPLSNRFLHLLASEESEILERVIRIVMRAKRDQEIRVNYAQLYLDLTVWPNRIRRDAVRTDWARAFWIFENKEEKTE